MRKVPLIKERERQAKLRSKLLQTYLRQFSLTQHVIRRLPHRWQIIHQRARPIEDDITYHPASVTFFLIRATESIPSQVFPPLLVSGGHDFPKYILDRRLD